MAVLIAVALALIYRYAPSRDEPKWRWISWGSVFAAVGWLVFSAAFSFYAANFGTFNKTYGSLGAVIGFMLWMWLSTTVILLGGKLNAEIEHQTERDRPKASPSRSASGAPAWPIRSARRRTEPATAAEANSLMAGKFASAGPGLCRFSP